MATSGVKYDDGTVSFAANCFPVRGIVRQTEDGEGAWLVAHRAEQRKRFKAVICAKPIRTYSRLREERKRVEKVKYTPVAYEDDEEETPVLDGFFLMKHCFVEDPTDLCSVNISGKGLSEVKEDDFALFDNVAYVNAGENYLPFEAFRGFPMLRELELPLNGLRGLNVERNWFPNLEMLDVSYNNLSEDDVLMLGTLPNVRVLHLSGNHLKTLPPDLAKTIFIGGIGKIQRFHALEMLMLDDNNLSEMTAFAALAGFRNLRHLNLQKNQIQSIPQLRLVGNKHVQESSPTLSRKKLRKSANSSKRSASRNSQSGKKSSKKGKKDNIADEQTHSIPEIQIETNTPRPKSNEIPKDGKVIEDKSDSGDKLLEKQEDEDELMMDSFRSLQLDESILENFDDPSHGTSISGGGTLATGTVTEVDEPLPPPFPELRYIDLSHNLIAEEEDLLAVAAWPLLSKLLIHDNPLTTERSGDPPLLTRFLTKRLGISLIRKKPTFDKPHIEVPVKPQRQVKLVVPPIPRINVDELLMLEAPPKAESVKEDDDDDTTPSPVLTKSSPLPPIVDQEADQGRKSKMAWMEDDTNKEKDGDAFFMTQVDDQSAEASARKLADSNRVPTPPKDEKPVRKEKKHRKKVPEIYKGYEVLVDVEDDPSIVVPTDIQGNVRALDFALKHPVRYGDVNPHIEKKQKPYKPFGMKNHGQAPAAVYRGYQGKVDDVLEHLKNRSAIVEADLESVLDAKAHKKLKEFPEATKLLSQVQRKYNQVRTTSMKEAGADAAELQAVRADLLKNMELLEKMKT